MPSKSKKQHNLMALVANDPKAAKRLGIPQSVGRDFMKADKGHKFNSGGFMKYRMRPMARGEMEMPMRRRGGAPMTMRKGGKAESPEMVRKEIAFMKKKGAPKSMIKHEEAEMGGKMKKGVRKFQVGGYMPGGISNPQNAVRAGARVASPRTEAQNLAGLRNINARHDARIYQMGKEAADKAYAESMAKGTFTGDVKNFLKSTPAKIGGGAILGSLATSYGPQIMDYISNMGPRKKPTVTVEEIDQSKGRARGGKIQSHKASKGPFRHAADGVAHKGKTKGRVVKMREGGMAYSEGGSVYRRAADGIASKGKTKGHMVKMRYGGKC